MGVPIRRGRVVTESSLRDVANKIVHRIRDWDIAERLVKKVKRYTETKNDRDDLTLDESSLIYRRDDYGDEIPISKKRDLDIGWTDHAEYRSDLRDIDHNEMNDGIAKWIRERLRTKGPDRKKVRMKIPGRGTAVVDFDTTRNPSDADVVTVWGSDMRVGSVDLGPRTLNELVGRMEGKVKLNESRFR